MALLDVSFPTIRAHLLPSGIDVRGVAACHRIEERCTTYTVGLAMIGIVRIGTALRTVLASVVYATSDKVDAAKMFPPYAKTGTHGFHVIMGVDGAKLPSLVELVGRIGSVIRAPPLVKNDGMECDVCEGIGWIYNDGPEVDGAEPELDHEGARCVSCDGGGWFPGSRAKDYDGDLTRVGWIPHQALDPAWYDFATDEDVEDAWIECDAHRDAIMSEPYRMDTYEDLAHLEGSKLGERACIRSNETTYVAEDSDDHAPSRWLVGGYGYSTVSRVDGGVWRMENPKTGTIAKGEKP